MWWVADGTAGASVRPGTEEMAGVVRRAQDGDPEAFRCLYRDI
jgi:hypothetical protein